MHDFRTYNNETPFVSSTASPRLALISCELLSTCLRGSVVDIYLTSHLSTRELLRQRPLRVRPATYGKSRAVSYADFGEDAGDLAPPNEADDNAAMAVAELEAESEGLVQNFNLDLEDGGFHFLDWEH